MTPSEKLSQDRQLQERVCVKLSLCQVLGHVVDMYYHPECSRFPGEMI